ncbi:MAG: MarR family transcriptional regulator [Novosphingobium sp.]
MKVQDDIRRIAEKLLMLADAQERGGELPQELGNGLEPIKVRRNNDDPTYFADPDVMLAIAKAIYRGRRARASHFPADLLGEPLWDILLDLYIEKAQARSVSITSACVASNVPPTTALRWLKVLEEGGWIFREDDVKDRRRSFLRLSEKAEIAVVRCLIGFSSKLRPVPNNESIFKGWRP